MTTSKALVEYSAGNNGHPENNGNSVSASPNPLAKNGSPTNGGIKYSPAPQPGLSDEVVDEILKGSGLRGWLRAAKIAEVLGLLSLYLFLDGYDIRASFNRRFAQRSLDVARTDGRIALFREWSRDLARLALDRAIRIVRFVVFRGAEGSRKKEARLAKQAVWLRDRLIDLGPTFIKIGQALGTRADLLPLAYVKEL